MDCGGRPSRQESLRRFLCLVGYHRPERIEAVAGTDELESVVCGSCGARRLRRKEPADGPPRSRPY